MVRGRAVGALNPISSGLTRLIALEGNSSRRMENSDFKPRGRYPGCQRFFAARFVTCRPKAGRWSREKTSGEERFDLLFSLNFDHSYRITFKPITANISYCDHMHQHVKISQIWVFNYKRYFNVSNGGICWWLSQEFFKNKTTPVKRFPTRSLRCPAVYV